MTIRWIAIAWFAASIAAPCARAEERADVRETLAVGDNAHLAIELVRITAGAFTMGRDTTGSMVGALLNWEASGRHTDEGPARRVVLTEDFSIGRYKITCDQYCEFLNSVDNPARHIALNKFARIGLTDGRYVPEAGCGSSAVNTVHWAGADAFCRWLSRRTNRTVRLPTEAEWEYVARGPEGRRHPWGDGRLDEGAAAARRQEMRGRPVDAFLHDATPEGVVGMTDTVGEWCSDYYGVAYLPDDLIDPQGPAKDQLPVKPDSPLIAAPQGVHHVLRGRSSSTTSRTLGSDASRSGIYGFRVVVEVE